jgi:FkbM family methyltransferase
MEEVIRQFVFQRMNNLKLLLDLVGSVLREKGLLKRNKHGIWEYKNSDGIKFKLRRYCWDSGIIMETWWLNEYLRFSPEIKENSIIIDVGAHIGAFSLFIASKFNNVKVLAFEPDPDNFALLTANIKLNGLENNIFPYRLAFSNKSGKKIKINIHPYNTGMSSATQSYKGLVKGQKSYFEALTVSLDDIFVKHNITNCDLLKMDCEGCEYVVILNTKEGTLKKIKNLSLEYHKCGDIKQIKKRLEDIGFKTKFDRAISNKIIGGLVKAPLLSAKRGN